MNLEPEFKANPFEQFELWFAQAVASTEPDPEAMTLATATSEGHPAARIVLFKGVEDQKVKFFTNYKSRKGHDLSDNPYAALVFYWPILKRQVRIEGKIEKLSAAASDAYWKSRPRGSQIGGLASKQSETIESYADLREVVKALEKKFEGKEIPRPDHWGGFGLSPTLFEFWISQADRLHHRMEYKLVAGQWKTRILSP